MKLNLWFIKIVLDLWGNNSKVEFYGLRYFIVCGVGLNLHWLHLFIKSM